MQQKIIDLYNATRLAPLSAVEHERCLKITQELLAEVAKEGEKDKPKEGKVKK